MRAQDVVSWALQADPVAELSGKEFQKSEVSLVNQVSDYFKSIGGKAESPEYGMVKLDRRGIKSSIFHGLGRIKAAAFKAVPDVIKNGRTLAQEQNWKGRNYDGYVVIAPININCEKYIVSVIIQHFKSGTNSYYLHEVIKEKELRGEIKTPAEARRSIIAKYFAENQPVQ